MMERVVGIDGFFFCAQHPTGLGAWYRQHLGINLPPANYDELPWRQESGPTVFAAFPETTMYFEPTQNQWMINFRVRRPDAIVAQLRAAGITVEIDPQAYPNGRFARLTDPEGNAIHCGSPRSRCRRGIPEFQSAGQ